eukprot:1123678-Amorphochlora_amoeboformis.AAC.2
MRQATSLKQLGLWIPTLVTFCALYTLGILRVHGTNRVVDSIWVSPLECLRRGHAASSDPSSARRMSHATAKPDL